METIVTPGTVVGTADKNRPGKGIEEKGYSDGKCVIKCDEEFYRPAEVQLLHGDSTRAQKELGWKFQYTFETLMDDMIDKELESHLVKP
mgnify:CR=1 FL=1